MPADLVTLTKDAMALPVEERIALAQQLWESLSPPATDDTPASLPAELARRDADMDRDPSLGRSHEEVMKAARDVIR